MMNPRFHCWFLDFDPDPDPILDRYRDYFLNYGPDIWARGAGDAVFDATYENGDAATFYVLAGRELGMSVRINLRRAGDRMGEEFYSVGDDKQMDDVRDIGDEHLVPAGSFVMPEQAWLALQDFFSHPFDRSGRVQWLSSKALRWPDE